MEDLNFRNNSKLASETRKIQLLVFEANLSFDLKTYSYSWGNRGRICAKN